jgi:hypothetical protein
VLDPYKPPASSTVLESKSEGSRRLAWKIYAFTITLFCLPVYVVLLVTKPTQAVFLDAGLTWTGQLGLFAYAFRRSIFSRQFWSLFAIVIPAHDVISMFVLHPPGNVLLTVALMSVSVPNYIAVALYAFRSPELWEAGPALTS